MIESADIPDDDDLPRLRFVQHAGRRHAIRIEPPFWSSLEDAARESGTRLNRIVAALAQHQKGPKNLAARLRLYALKRAQRLARQSALRSANVDLAAIVTAVPVPAFAFTQDRMITKINQAAEQWTGQVAGDLEGAPVAEIFRIRFKQPHADPFRALANDDGDQFEGSIAYMPPGRVLVRPIRACRVRGDDGDDPGGPENYVCLVFIG